VVCQIQKDFRRLGSSWRFYNSALYDNDENHRKTVQLNHSVCFLATNSKNTRSAAVAVKAHHNPYNVGYSCLLVYSFKLKPAFDPFQLLF